MATRRRVTADKPAETEFLSVDELLKIDSGEGTTSEGYTIVDLPSGRGKVAIRPLRRDEVLQCRGDKMSPVELEIAYVAMAMVEPKMTKTQVRAWQKRPGNIRDMEEVTRAIARISGMSHGTDKSDLQSNGSSLRSGVGDADSEESRDDSGTSQE